MKGDMSYDQISLLIEDAQAAQTVFTAPGDHAILTPACFDPSLQKGQQPHLGHFLAHPNHRKGKIWLLEGGYKI